MIDKLVEDAGDSLWREVGKKALNTAVKTVVSEAIRATVDLIKRAKLREQKAAFEDRRKEEKEKRKAREKEEADDAQEEGEDGDDGDPDETREDDGREDDAPDEDADDGDPDESDEDGGDAEDDVERGDDDEDDTGDANRTGPTVDFSSYVARRRQ